MLKCGRCLIRSALLAALLATFLISSVSAAALSTLGPGSKGDKVRVLQEELQEKGYYTAKVITEVYTSALAGAVSVFQKANSIKPAKFGYADEQTQVRAASNDAVLYAEYIDKQMDAQLQPGGMGAYVKNAQYKLKALGYYSGSISGKYGGATTSAARYFQTANSLDETGNLDAESRALLYAKAPDPLPLTRAQYEAANFLTPLSYGSKGAQVMQLKTRLADLGFYWGEITDKYDLQTKYSVKLFQVANGFSATGSASKALREKINRGSCVSFDAYTQNMQLLPLSSGSKPGIKVAVLQVRLRNLGYYKGIINGSYTSSVITAVRTFQIFNYPTITSVTGKADTTTRTLMNGAAAVEYIEVCGVDTLKPGDTGEAVRNLQTKLKELGYYKGAINGVYGSVVASAVKVFQQYNGFYPSGVAYTQTLTKLNDGTAKSYTNVKIEKLIGVADKLMDAGAKYSTRPNPPYSFDCSRFTAYCLKKVGVYVSGEIRAQGRSRVGTVIKLDDPKKNSNYYKALKKGDLLFFWSPDRKKKPGHSAIYLGSNKFIHASSGAGKVTVSGFTAYNERSGGPWFLWAIRIWE